MDWYRAIPRWTTSSRNGARLETPATIGASRESIAQVYSAADWEYCYWEIYQALDEMSGGGLTDPSVWEAAEEEENDYWDESEAYYEENEEDYGDDYETYYEEEEDDDEEMSIAEAYTLDASDCDTAADEQECEAYLQMRKHYRLTRKGRNKDPHQKARRYGRPFIRRRKGGGKGRGKYRRRPWSGKSAGKSSQFGKGKNEWYRRPFGKSKGKGKGKNRRFKSTFPAHLLKGKGKGKGKTQDNWQNQDGASSFPSSSSKGFGYGKGSYGKGPPYGSN